MAATALTQSRHIVVPAETAVTVVEPGSTVSPWVDFFDHRGKRYRMFKRFERRDASWYLRYEFEQKPHLVCAKTNDRDSAARFFKAHVDASWTGRLQALKKQREEDRPVTFSSIGTLMECYQHITLDMDDKTRRQNVNCLKNALRRAYEEKAIEDLSVGELDDNFVRRYFEASLKQARAACGSQADEARSKRTANSILNQAKSIFKPKALALMRRPWVDAKGKAREGLALPESFNAFGATVKEEKFERVSSAEFTAPADKVIKATLEKWRELPRNEFIAAGMALSFGLRLSETAQTCWNLFTVVEGRFFLRGNIDVKARTGYIEVSALDPFYSEMMRRIASEKWRGAAGDFVLQGTTTDRTDNIFRNVSAWMRRRGWETQKTNHALRAYAGSQVAMRYGVYTASVWLRHSSVKVTEQHYLKYLEVHKMDNPNPENLPTRWAKVEECETERGYTLDGTIDRAVDIDCAG